MSRGSSMLSRLFRSFGYDALLTPAGLLALALALSGGRQRALRLWAALTRRVLGDPDPAPSAKETTTARVAGHGVLSVGVGLLAWFLLGTVVLVLARGLFYGFVDRGPYDDSWGGPTLAGAWVVHFLVSVPYLVFAVWMLRRLAVLHSRSVRLLHGEPVSRWVVPLLVAIWAAGVVFFVAWLQQI